jgi:predicted RNA-binding Zn-ribbon protein involved in translation (DUF1610 family)
MDAQERRSKPRTLPSDETWIGEQETLECPNCLANRVVRDSAQAFEGDWVNKCWSCGFMFTDWRHER